MDQLKQLLSRTQWWQYVQPEVKNALEFLIDNLETLGPFFRNAFVSAFQYEHAFRTCQKQVLTNQPGALFGKGMTEECYNSGILPTKALLHLDDWVSPNDADVQACMFLYQLIEQQTKIDAPQTTNQTEELADQSPVQSAENRSLADKFFSWFGRHQK